MKSLKELLIEELGNTNVDQIVVEEYINTKEYGSKSKDSLTSILSASENTYKSITAVFGQKMNLFDDINVANVTSTSDFKFSDLGKQPTALYVIVPDEDKEYPVYVREDVHLNNSEYFRMYVKYKYMLESTREYITNSDNNSNIRLRVMAKLSTGDLSVSPAIKAIKIVGE